MQQSTSKEKNFCIRAFTCAINISSSLIGRVAMVRRLFCIDGHLTALINIADRQE